MRSISESLKAPRLVNSTCSRGSHPTRCQRSLKHPFQPWTRDFAHFTNVHVPSSRIPHQRRNRVGQTRKYNHLEEGRSHRGLFTKSLHWPDYTQPAPSLATLWNVRDIHHTEIRLLHATQHSHFTPSLRIRAIYAPSLSLSASSRTLPQGHQAEFDCSDTLSARTTFSLVTQPPTTLANTHWLRPRIHPTSLRSASGNFSLGSFRTGLHQPQQSRTINTLIHMDGIQRGGSSQTSNTTASTQHTSTPNYKATAAKRKLPISSSPTAPSTLESKRPAKQPRNKDRLGQSNIKMAHENGEASKAGTNGLDARGSSAGSDSSRLEESDVAGAGDDMKEVGLSRVSTTAQGGPETVEWQATIEKVVKNVVAIHFCQTCSFDTETSISSEATGFVVDVERGFILTNRVGLLLFLIFSQY
jgi:hypothetical protein